MIAWYFAAVQGAARERPDQIAFDPRGAGAADAAPAVDTGRDDLRRLVARLRSRLIVPEDAKRCPVDHDSAAWTRPPRLLRAARAIKRISHV